MVLSERNRATVCKNMQRCGVHMIKPTVLGEFLEGYVKVEWIWSKHTCTCITFSNKNKHTHTNSLVSWHMLVIPILGRQKEVDSGTPSLTPIGEFYTNEWPHLKLKTKQKVNSAWGSDPKIGQGCLLASMYLQMCTHRNTHMCTQTCKHTQTHRCIHTYAHVYIYIHTHMPIYIHTCIHTNIHMHTFIYIHIRAHMHTYASTHF